MRKKIARAISFFLSAVLFATTIGSDFANHSVQAAAGMLTTAVSCGVNFFDHATCYGNGEAETRLGDAFRLAGLRREDVYIQSKCGLHFDLRVFD